MRNWTDTEGLKGSRCPFDQDVDFAAMTARRVGIPFSVVDLSDEYRQRVVDYLFAEYARGRTPNPDVLCNREIKFKAFWEVARARGANFVATGHYCRKAIAADGEYQLLRGADDTKDQSYFLCQVTQEQLSHALFPVGEMAKREVRALAKSLGLPTAERRDSYGICFVGGILWKYREARCRPMGATAWRRGRRRIRSRPVWALWWGITRARNFLLSASVRELGWGGRQNLSLW